MSGSQRRQEQEHEQDHGAGLIHQVASPLAETEPRPIYTGPIKAGMHFIWEKDNPKAWAHVVVVAVVGRDGYDNIVWTETIPLGVKTWNEESRCREAFTPCDEHGELVGSGNPAPSAERAVPTGRSAAPKDSPSLTSQTPSGSVEATAQYVAWSYADHECGGKDRGVCGLCDTRADSILREFTPFLAVQHSKEQP